VEKYVCLLVLLRVCPQRRISDVHGMLKPVGAAVTAVKYEY